METRSGLDALPCPIENACCSVHLLARSCALSAEIQEVLTCALIAEELPVDGVVGFCKVRVSKVVQECLPLVPLLLGQIHADQHSPHAEKSCHINEKKKRGGLILILIIIWDSRPEGRWVTISSSTTFSSVQFSSGAGCSGFGANQHLPHAKYVTSPSPPVRQQPPKTMCQLGVYIPTRTRLLGCVHVHHARQTCLFNSFTVQATHTVHR